MTSFKDELRSNTPSHTIDTWDYESKMAITHAELMYFDIKKYLMTKAKLGEYTWINEKKCIKVEMKSSYIQQCIKRYNQTISTKKLFSRHYNIENRLDYSFSPDALYNVFMKTLKELTSKDGISIQPIFYEQDTFVNRRVTLPYTNTSVANLTHKVIGYIEATIEY